MAKTAAPFDPALITATLGVAPPKLYRLSVEDANGEDITYDTLGDDYGYVLVPDAKRAMEVATAKLVRAVEAGEVEPGHYTIHLQGTKVDDVGLLQWRTKMVRESVLVGEEDSLVDIENYDQTDDDGPNDDEDEE